MGVIAIRHEQEKFQSIRIPRLPDRLAAGTFAARRSIEIVPYNRPFNEFASQPILKPLADKRVCVETNATTYDLLWHFSWFIPDKQPRPHWSGFMKRCVGFTEFFRQNLRSSFFLL